MRLSKNHGPHGFPRIRGRGAPVGQFSERDLTRPQPNGQTIRRRRSGCGQKEPSTRMEKKKEGRSCRSGVLVSTPAL